MYNSINYENTNYNITFTDIQYEINIINPLIELKRYNLIQEIKIKINTIFQKYSLDIDVNNILPRFIMVQYKNKSYYVDPILPYNASEYAQLKKDLYIFTNKKLKNNDIDNLIKEIDLTELFNNAIEDLKTYIKLHTNNLALSAYKIDIEKKEDYIYISFNINDTKEYLYESLILNKFKLHKNLYNKLLENYIHKKDDSNFKKLLICLLLRYNTLESYNQQLSINPDFKNSIKKKYNINFELFASSINCEFNNYCSLFYDIEKNFNSKGNFTSIKLKKGFFISNPPFDEEIMKNMSLKFIESLKDKKNDELSILITIPYWINDYYNNYESYNLLKSSGLITYEKIIEKKNSIFFDYYKNTYITPCKIFLIVIQNEKGKIHHKIGNEFNELVNKYFSNKYLYNLQKNLQKGGSNNKNVNENKLILELKNNKNIKFNVNVKLKDYPQEYRLKIAKEFYLSRAKFYYEDLYKLNAQKGNLIKRKSKIEIKKKGIDDPKIKYIIYILKNIFKDIEINSLSLIDLRYNCSDFNFLKERSELCYYAILEYLLLDKSFVSTKFNFMFNPLFELSKKEKYEKFIKNINYNKLFDKIQNNQDFVIIGGTVEYFTTKTIYYYLEQYHNLFMFLQIFYLINILKKGGNFIMICWTLSTDMCKDYILLLNKYFEKIYLVKNTDISGNTNISGNMSCIVGIGFKLLNKTDKNKFQKIYDELQDYIIDTIMGNNINILNKQLRHDKYIFKPIRREDSTHFIHKLFNLEMDKKEKQKLIKKINSFHQKIFEKIMY